MRLVAGSVIVLIISIQLCLVQCRFIKLPYTINKSIVLNRMSSEEGSSDRQVVSTAAAPRAIGPYCQVKLVALILSFYLPM